MKKTIILLAVALASIASAQTSNLLSYVNIGSGANTGDGDPLRTAFGKINGNFALLSSIVDSNAASGGGITNFSFTAASVSSTSAPSMIVVGVTNGIAYCFASIPAGSAGATGAPGTNTVNVTNVYTAYNPTNSIETSSRFTITNIATLNFAGTNFIGQFSQLDSFDLSVPILGAVGIFPGSNEFEQVWLNYTATNWSGTNGWFLPDSASSTMIYTNIAVAVVGAVGSSGALTLYGMDHPEAAGRYNMIYRQGIGTQQTPVLPTDLVNLQTLNNALASYFASPLVKSVDSNQVTHVQMLDGQKVLMDATSQHFSLFVDSVVASGTNLLISVNVTNMFPGYTFQVSTNLGAADGGFYTSSSFTVSTNSGEVVFTTPMLASYSFYRMRLNYPNTFVITPQLTLPAGTLYPPNAWSLTTITSTMPNFSFWTGNSNGQALVSVSVSNGVASIKQLAP
jgi:hypothetical protein